MTDNDKINEEIEHLKEPPQLKGTKKGKWSSLVRDICAGVAIVALVIGLINIKRQGSQAKEQNGKTLSIVSCVNSILGDRAPLTTKDNNALVKVAESLNSFLTGKNKDISELQTSLENFINTVLEDQQYRNSHPLGKC